MARARRPLLSLLPLLVPAAARADDGQPIDVVALFARNCATCHGLDGSGTGPSVLDRPARNFKEGGFSFGNTPEAIARTLAHGIPGSPMPSFEGVLSEDERRALAEYVVTLGPPIKAVSEAETLLVVKDRPLVVRGILPPLLEGGAVIPRGLLIGMPDGLTFEYDLQDVRLIAVRAGEFARRTDWDGRGGTPLEPLGKVVWSESQLGFDWNWCEKDDDVSPALESRLTATLVTRDRVQLSVDLLSKASQGRPSRFVTSVNESVSAVIHLGLSGFRRTFRIEGPSVARRDALVLTIPFGTPPRALRPMEGQPACRMLEDRIFWGVGESAAGDAMLLGLRAQEPVAGSTVTGDLEHHAITLSGQGPFLVEVNVLMASVLDPSVERALRDEGQR